MIQVNNKFNIGDKVYFIDSNKKAACSVVKGIFVHVYNDNVSTSYNLESDVLSLEEELAFATESELKDYVFRDLIEFV
jgi:hypothetical protein